MGRLSKKNLLGYLPTRSVTLSPAQVAGATTAAENFTVAGVRPGDVVIVRKAAQQAGLFVADAWVAAANTLTILFCNATSNPILPTAEENYTIVQIGTGG